MKNIHSDEVVLWAKDFLDKAGKALTPAEVKEQRMFASLVTNPKNKVLLTKLLDESSQIRDTRKLSRRMKKLFETYGVPDFFGKTYEYLGYVFRDFGYLFDFIAVPIFKSVLRKETEKIIIREERPALTKHLSRRRHDKIGQNVNLLGEVVLGDAEADHRYHHYLEALRQPDINYISIKISGIYAQLHPLSYDRSKEELCRRIATIFQAAIDHPYMNEEGVKSAKFVNLDMEEYKDTELTLDVFMEVMRMPQFAGYTAGIVVQAYLPDAIGFYERLLAFAKERVAGGGAPIKVRLVKGANLQMETIVSSLKGWPNPVLPSKVDVDANYMRILDIAMKPENARVVHLGVASHNFFTIGYAFLLSQANGVEDYVTFEMLEGMANHLPRVMRAMEKQVILYTPVVGKKHFLNAVSYLVRRLDENTGKDNFLTYSFNLTVHSDEWHFLQDQFLAAYHKKDSMRSATFRTQDRNRKPEPIQDIDTFTNEPDTDLDLKANRLWALEALRRWSERRADEYVIPAQVGERELITSKKKKYYDRSRNDDVCVCEVNMSTPEQVEEIMAIAQADASGWRGSTLAHRNRVLHDVADLMAARRGDLVGCMSAITGKTFMEGDVEVSEGIDFCRYYPISMRTFEDLAEISYRPKGIVMVISPWNFPLAIPVGGVAAALSGGNSVILKPATVAFPVAWEFAKCFWEAGVPKDTLQVVCPADRSSLEYLSEHPAVKHIILTGGTDTAFKLLNYAPRTPLSAETGGKNAIIMTAAADQDHAIQNVVASAFGNAGQKCSACSLLLVDRTIYEDETFKAKLRDAVSSLRTGSVWHAENVIGPMITNENDKLLHDIEHLAEGESWLVPPLFMDEKRYILHPCVKWGVRRRNHIFHNELFAPLLAVVCIDSLEEGLRYANYTDYGLTAGLQSLDETEIAYWKEHIVAGNLYINRGITGAIVRRQPFGGMKLSAFGAGIKAGGPNYVACFVEFDDRRKAAITDRDALFRLARQNYIRAWEEEFSVERDVSHIVGEQNTFRYLPVGSLAIRVSEKDDLTDVLLAFFAAITVVDNVTLSVDPRYPDLEVLRKEASDYGHVLSERSDEDFMINLDLYERVRICGHPEYHPYGLFSCAADLGLYIATTMPVAEGRVELLHYLKEQSIAYEYHRYGSIT